MSLAILFHFLCTQHVSDINISIITSLRLFCWITILVVSFLVRCVLEFRCGWVGVVSVLQASACNTDTTPTQPHRNSNTHRNKNNTTNVVIQQNSRKLLMMDILMPETCWVHKKWNKIASDIKLAFYSSRFILLCVFCAVQVAASATSWSLVQRSPIGYGWLIVCHMETSSKTRLGPSVSETDNDNLDTFSHPPARNSNTRPLDFWSSVLST